MTPKIDFDKFGVEYTPPPDRKYPYWKAIIRIVLSVIKRINSMFSVFRIGSTGVNWAPGGSYAMNEEIIFDRKVYRSLIAANSTAPDAQPQNWQLVSDFFIGMEERMMFDFKRISMEYALNKYFGTTFRQPNVAVNYTRSDIYIDTLGITQGSFISYGNPELSDRIYGAMSSNFVYGNVIFAGSTTFIFEIAIPSATFTQINADPIVAEKIVRQFVDQFVPSGISYAISQY